MLSFSNACHDTNMMRFESETELKRHMETKHIVEPKTKTVDTQVENQLFKNFFVCDDTLTSNKG